MAPMPAISPLRARLGCQANNILRDTFVCRRCVHQAARAQDAFRSTRHTAFLKAFRQPHLRRTSRAQSSLPSLPQTLSSPLDALSHSIGAQSSTLRSTAAGKASSWPRTSSPAVAYWLLGSAVSVFGIVVFGGLTRLTESGLSITEWRPVTGSLPPRNEQVWEEEFARYKRSPEFKMLNSRMNLEEFKQIYWMEWGHRLWGRMVGITFLLPTAYFVIRRRVSSRMALRLTGICGLIGFQGFLGWWMVKSGLKDDLLETGKHPRVSQYRLAAHLGTAFVAYLCMLWNGLQILRENAILRRPTESLKLLQILQSPQLRTFRRLVGGLSALTFITAISGALVAGLDAGLIYNDFPWMGQGLLPPTSEMLDPFYSHTPDQQDLVWRNMLENPVLVQLDHRVLAMTTFSAVMALWGYSHFSPTVRKMLPKAAKSGMLGVVHLVSLQVVLGITTLWYLVPTPIAAAHQAGALALLTGVFVLGGRVWVPKRTLQLAQQAASQLQGNPTLSRKAPDAMVRAKLDHHVGVLSVNSRRAFASSRQALQQQQEQHVQSPPSPPPPTIAQDGKTTHFGFQTVAEDIKAARVGAVFSSVAANYDTMNDLMSLGIHRLWKDHFVRSLNPGITQSSTATPQQGQRILDVAGGTGDIALRMLDHATSVHNDTSTSVIVSDINAEMLAEGRKRLSSRTSYVASNRVSFLEANAETLYPHIADASIDLYTVAFGIRNFTHKEAALREAFRVLKPGGVFACLEFTPALGNPLMNAVYKRWSFGAIPLIGQLVAADRDSYQYLVESIERFPSQREFRDMIAEAGFLVPGGIEGKGWEDLTMGIAAIHKGVKPAR